MTLCRDEFDSFLTSTFDLTPDIEAFAEGPLGGRGRRRRRLSRSPRRGACRRSVSTVVALRRRHGPAGLPGGRRAPSGAAAGPGPLDRLRCSKQPGIGIKIFPVSSSGTDDQAEFVLRQLAQFSGARYVFLTYGAEGPRHRPRRRYRPARLRGTVPGRPDSPPSRRGTGCPGRRNRRGGYPRTPSNRRRRPTRQLSFPWVA